MAIRQKVFESNNKGLFDIAVGEGNISAKFATELQNARVSLNGEVSKRRGRTFFNRVAAKHAAGNSIDTLAASNHDAQLSVYSGNNEQVGFAITLGSDKNIQSVQFYLDAVGTPTAGSVVRSRIYAAQNTVGTNATPTGDVLATSLDVAVSVITGTFALVEFTFEEPYAATAGDYCVLLEYDSGDSSNYIRVGTDASSPAHGSNAFSTNASGGSWTADATQDIIFDLISAGPSIVSLMLFEGDFVDDYEILAQCDTRLLRYTPSTSAFDIVIKTGLTAGERLNWTMFSGNLVMTNGTDNPFKYGYLPKASAPSTGTSTSGAKSGRTYYVAVSYITANGETVASSETTQAVSANDVLDVTAPTTIAGATGWNVYYSETSGALKLQNASPLTLGVNHQETTGSLNDGAAPASTNTAWHSTDLADNPPKGKYIMTLNSRVWMAGMANRETQFVGSAVANEDDWSSLSDYVDIDVGAVLARGDRIVGISRLGQTGKLILGLKNHIVTYDVPTVFSDIAIDKIVFNTGALSHRAMDEVGLDNYIVEREGLNSLKNEIIVQGLKTKKLSDNIRDRINPLLDAVSDPGEINVLNNKTDNEFWINIPSISRRYIYDYSIKSWMEDRGLTIYQSVLAPDGKRLSAGDNGRVYTEYHDSSSADVHGDGDDNRSVSFQWDTPWLWLDSIQVKKMFKYFRFKGTGSAGQFTLDQYLDFSSSSYKTYYLQTVASTWGDIDWDSGYWDFPDINKVLVPMVGMGKAVKFSFKANHADNLGISFYGVSFAPAGMRAND